MARKKNKGRQKVEMVKMQNDSNLQVTFSKRRSGLFKKASELCTLCGAEAALVVFSPGNKVFSFGHPGVETLIDRFVSRSAPESSSTMQLIEAHRNANVRELNMQLTQVMNQLEAERKRAEDLNQMRKASQNWWEAPVEQLNLTQLQQLRQALQELKKNVTNQAEEVLLQSTAPPPPQPQQPPMPPQQQQQFYMGSSSAGPAGGVLPYDPNKNMVNNVGFNPNMNMNHMMPPQGINPGFGHGFF
ncbi:hypothetical protein SLE2022_040440 [Rubroshorea leprosula]